MAERSRAELRKFGLVVGGLFLVVGTLSAWRGHVYPPRVCWTVGTPLVVLGVVAPSVLRPVEHAWMRFAERLGAINARIILSALYFLMLTPVGWIRRRTGDPLDRRVTAGTRWVRRPRGPVDPARYRQQF
jgi:saxitoxin biosynthesis operon SxtJ-like protein